MEHLPIEKSPEIIQKIPAPLTKLVSDCNTPSPDQKRPQGSPNSLNSGNDLKTTSTPDRLKVPKAFKYSERYQQLPYFIFYFFLFLIKNYIFVEDIKAQLI